MVLRLSIPFTSGRSSVLFDLMRFIGSYFSFNPLHVGAIIGSLPARLIRERRRTFNPLHVGAIIGSGTAWKRRGERSSFQSPSRRGDHRFASGAGRCRESTGGFQSPSRRGDHRFATAAWSMRSTWPFNPLHVGAIIGSATNRRWKEKGSAFNPLHVGAIIGSCYNLVTERDTLLAFNPLHVGAIIGSGSPALPSAILNIFQSPSRRGDHRFSPIRCTTWTSARLSIPFTSGRSSVHDRRAEAMALMLLSIPFTSGRSSVQLRVGRLHLQRHLSIPFTSGRSSVLRGAGGNLHALRTFNPLHVGAIIGSVRRGKYCRKV